MNLVLIGYRCTGKTTIGEILAEKLGRPLVDTDTLIQERAGRSIKEIVADGGWPEFRRLERDVIADVVARERQIISAGGGAVLDEKNRNALRASGRVILLTARPEVIWQRMKADPKTDAERPDLTDSGLRRRLDVASGIAEIANLLRKRRPTYLATCHYEIQTDRFSPAETAGRLLAWLKANRNL